MKLSIILTTLVACSEAARLSLNDGSLRVTEKKCGLACLDKLDCSSQDSIDAFSACIEANCAKDDTTVAHAVERFMSACHSTSQLLEDSALDHLKSIYVSSQMAILKRQAESMATNGTSSNGTNSSNSSTSSSGGTGTTAAGASTTRTGTYATSCSSLADVLDGSCIVRSSEANHKARNSVIAVFGVAALVAYII